MPLHLIETVVASPINRATSGPMLYWKRELGRDEHQRVMAVKATIERNADGTALLRLYMSPR